MFYHNPLRQVCPRASFAKGDSPPPLKKGEQGGFSSMTNMVRIEISIPSIKLLSFHRFYRFLGVFAVILLFSLFLPVSKAFSFTVISESKEVEIGRKADEEIIKKYGYYKNTSLQDYIDRVGQRLVREAEPRGFSYHFKVVDAEEENAFALPGGYIYITRGLLAYLNNEAQLAGVIGHEIAHAASRHAAEMLTKSLGYQFLTIGLLATGAAGGNSGNWAMVVTALSQQILLGYGRENELKADEMGILYASKAGYSPQQVVEFMKTLKFKERLKAIEYHPFMASHPETTQRVIKLQAFADSLSARQGNDKILENEFKEQLDGLTYGSKGEGKKIKIVKAQQGENLRELAERAVDAPLKAWDLAILNGLRESSLLSEGQSIKIITD